MSSDGGGFWLFRTMVTPTTIRVVYAIGAILILVGMIVLIGQCIQGEGGPGTWKISDPEKAFSVLMGAIISPFLWRIFCECIVLFFAIHEELVEVNKHLEWFRDVGIDVFPKKPPTQNLP